MCIDIRTYLRPRPLPLLLDQVVAVQAVRHLGTAQLGMALRTHLTQYAI